ncbi:MAG TPA: Trx7/PDZ domain-containing (seleno)protein [Methylomirabilota bacterium]|nr:Trx7/PDZ domain-containing (seleno)protein [Methylomirabilota bacterium]
MKAFATPLLVALLPFTAAAETVPDRKAAVLNDRARLNNDPRWIYNDYERGFAEGRRTGKPVLIVLRCIPCLGCAGIDARVLTENTELTALLDQFVRVRVINANALDLSRFQFDFDLSFSMLFFHGDGTLYGRYGSWVHQKDPREQATEGVRKALIGTLLLHKDYPANRDALAGKQPRPSPYKTPVDMPTLQGKYTRNLDWENKVVASCVHCHQIGDALRAVHRQRNETIPDSLIYPFPAPETVGLELALDHVARVKAVTAGSPAAAAGFRVGDDLVSFAGQPLISAADVSWALHQAPDAAALPVVAQREGRTVRITLALPEGWRHQADISRRVGTWPLRAMALGGLLLEDLSDAERHQRGLRTDQLALRARHVGEHGEHAAAKRAGFRKDDVLIEIDGEAGRLSEGALIGRLLRRHHAGTRVKAVILRGTERIETTLPMQ